MKFLRFQYNNKTRYGFIEDNRIIEVSAEDYLSDNHKGLRKCPVNVKILPPVNPSKIICVGLNYKDHADELGMEIPEEPIIFLKPPSSIIGDGEFIIYPSMSREVDYEVELAAVISKEAKNVGREDAEDFIAGYTILNDVTARDLQRKDGQWTRAKSFDTFCPIGPWIETDINPHELEISLHLNGELRQYSNTQNMIFDVYELVEFVSNIMTLKKGDIIATGTPPGVGSMKPGDEIEASIEGIGTLKNKVIYSK
ncbi:MAG: fumarylacetoacetate hydrolase family protein [Methanobacteriales archaeon]|nr:fumarylacetoacetate hydrolase family protein [Methanobacteriales archaeon]